MCYYVSQRVKLKDLVDYYQAPANVHLDQVVRHRYGAANELMADIHNSKFRQPIILDDEQISAWLDPKSDPVEIDMLMQPCDDSQMAAYRVPRELIKMGNVPEVLNKID